MSVGFGPITYASGTVPVFMNNNNGTSDDNFQYMHVVTAKSSFPSAYQSKYGVAMLLPATGQTQTYLFQLMLYPAVNYGGVPITYEVVKYYTNNNLDSNGVAAVVSGGSGKLGMIQIDVTKLHPPGLSIGSWTLITTSNIVPGEDVYGKASMITIYDTGGNRLFFNAKTSGSVINGTIKLVTFNLDTS